MSQSDNPCKPRIVPLPNGPYYYFSRLDAKPVAGITNSRHETLVHVPGVALCRCGHSSKRPFCDGSHKTCGFVSDEAPTPPAVD